MERVLLLIDRNQTVFLYNKGDIEVISVDEFNDLIGRQKIIVKNINNSLIAELYNKADYGSAKTLNNIIKNKNNISISELLRGTICTFCKSRTIYIVETGDLIKIELVDKKSVARKIDLLQSDDEVIIIDTDNTVRLSTSHEVDYIEASKGKTGSSKVKNELANSENKTDYGKDLAEDKNSDNQEMNLGNILKNEDDIDEKIDEQLGQNLSSSEVENFREKSEEEETVGGGISFDDEDESDSDDDSDDEEINLMYKEYDSECPYCHGSGVREHNGFKIECECGKRVAERKAREAEIERQKAAENITGATRINAVSIGLIPEEYKDIEYSNRESLESLRRRANGRTIVGRKRYMAAMNSILTSCKTGVKLKHSYLLAGDKGFSKKTFVYTCLKYLFQRGARPVKYMSLSEIGLIRADVIKNAMAVTNTGYYFKDRDEEKIQMLMTKSVDLLIKSIIQKAYEATRDEFGGEFDDETGKAVANYTMNLLDSKHSIDNNINKIKEINSNQLKGIASNIRSRVLEEVYAKYNSFKQSSAEVNADELDKFITKQVDTWNDIVNTPILFTYLSGSLNKQFETEVLQVLLNERGNKCLPTIVMCDTSTQGYRDEFGYVEDMSNNTRISYIKARSAYWDNMISENSSFNLESTDANKLDEEIRGSIEYDRLIYINSYVKRETSVIPGVNI